MFTIEDRPTVEVHIDSECDLFWKNVCSVIKTPNIDRVILKYKNSLSAYHRHRIFQLVKEYAWKEFYIPHNLQPHFCELDNSSVFFYESMSVRKEHDDSTVLFFDIDCTKYEDDFYWTRVENILKCRHSIVVCTLNPCDTAVSTALASINKIRNVIHTNELDNVYLSNHFVSTELIRIHPCNLYLCGGNTCHSNKSRYPRNFTLTPEGAFPYGVRSRKIAFFMDIAKREICDFSAYAKEEYQLSREYATFLEATKWIYQEYISLSSLSIIPLNFLLNKALETV